MWSHSVDGVVRPMWSQMGHNGNAWMTLARSLCQRDDFNRGSSSDPVGTPSKGRMGVPLSRNDLAGLVFFGLDFHGRRRSRLGMFGIGVFEYTSRELFGYFVRALARPLPPPFAL